MTRTGCDFAENPHPSPSGLRAAGMDFVVRYFVTSSTIPGKPVKPAEVAAYAAAGIDVVANWERAAKALLGGYAAGFAAAEEALAVAAACGMPAGRPVYYSADWDVQAGEQAAVNAFLRGAADASPGGLDQVGIYAGYNAVKRTLDAGACRWAWQTYAWSAGRWDPRAQLRQVQNGITVAGGNVDRCTAMTSDFGQWRPGYDPTQEDDMNADQDFKLDNLYAGAFTGGESCGEKNPDTGTNSFVAKLDYLMASVAALLAAAGTTPTATADAQAIAAALAANPAFVAAVADGVAANLSHRLES